MDATTGIDSDSNSTATILGVLAAALALSGAVVPLQATPADPAVLAVVALTAVSLGAFLGRAAGALDRRPAAIAAGVASLLLVLVATYALVDETAVTVSVPVLGEGPALVVAVLAGGAGLAAAAAEYAGLSGRAMARRAGATAVYGSVGVLGYLLIAVWIALLAPVAVPLLTDGGGIEALTDTDEVVLQQVATVLGLGTTAAGFLLWTGRDRSFVDLETPGLRDVAYVVGGFVAVIGAAYLFEWILQAVGAEPAGHSTVAWAEENPEILLALIPASILVIGPFEELLYRNVVQKSLYEYFSRGGAVVAASVPFALVHFSAYGTGTVGQSLVSLGIVASLSLLLGVVYERTENLLVPALVHGLYNASLFALLYVQLAL